MGQAAEREKKSVNVTKRVRKDILASFVICLKSWIQILISDQSPCFSFLNYEVEMNIFIPHRVAVRIR